MIAQKAIISKLKELGLPRNVETVHYGALRGLNRFKDVSAAVVIGRPAIANSSLEQLTEALYLERPVSVRWSQRSERGGAAT